jgi:hypothetical protein
MGRYMTVVLKKAHQNETFIIQLNHKLTGKFGANTSVKFNSWQFLQEEADYINNHPEGKKQLPGWERPVTKETLHHNFFWLRMGEFSFKLSGTDSTDDARDAVAVCKWLKKQSAGTSTKSCRTIIRSQ